MFKEALAGTITLAIITGLFGTPSQKDKCFGTKSTPPRDFFSSCLMEPFEISWDATFNATKKPTQKTAEKPPSSCKTIEADPSKYFLPSTEPIIITKSFDGKSIEIQSDSGKATNPPEVLSPARGKVINLDSEKGIIEIQDNNGNIFKLTDVSGLYKEIKVGSPMGMSNIAPFSGNITLEITCNGTPIDPGDIIPKLKNASVGQTITP